MAECENVSSPLTTHNSLMMFKRISVIPFLILSYNAIAQPYWDRVDSLFGTLPSAIKVYRTNDSLNGRPFRAFFIEINLKDKSLQYSTQTGKGARYTPYQYYVKEDSPLLVVNGGFFSFQTNQNLSLIMQKGALTAYNIPALKSQNSDSFYYPTRAAFGLTKHRRPGIAWTFTDSAEALPYAFPYAPIMAKGKTGKPTFRDLHTLDQWKWWKMNTAIGGGPMLVKNGQQYITYKEEQLYTDSANARHPRTAIGYTRKKKLIILVIQGRFPGIAEGATLEEEAKILVNLNCI